jgi:RimJ/RimL family protein N-acetyltransferase
MIAYRAITEGDAEAFLDLRLHLDSESNFMMYEPGERNSSPEDERDHIRAVLKAPNQNIIVADASGTLAGYIGLYGGEFRRLRHVAYIVVGVRSAFAGKGIGTSLFEAGQAWARSAGIRRLELTVMTHNEPAIRLYRRMGFEIEGTRRRAMHVGDRWVDEYYMAKLLD